MKELSDRVKNNEREKSRFFRNLSWIIAEYSLTLPKKSTEFKTIEEWEAYMAGADDAVNARNKDIINRLQYGIVETNDMFENDWTKG